MKTQQRVSRDEDKFPQRNKGTVVALSEYAGTEYDSGLVMVLWDDDKDTGRAYWHPITSLDTGRS